MYISCWFKGMSLVSTTEVLASSSSKCKSRVWVPSLIPVALCKWMIMSFLSCYRAIQGNKLMNASGLVISKQDSLFTSHSMSLTDEHITNQNWKPNECYELNENNLRDPPVSRVRLTSTNPLDPRWRIKISFIIKPTVLCSRSTLHHCLKMAVAAATGSEFCGTCSSIKRLISDGNNWRKLITKTNSFETWNDDLFGRCTAKQPWGDPCQFVSVYWRFMAGFLQTILCRCQYHFWCSFRGSGSFWRKPSRCGATCHEMEKSLCLFACKQIKHTNLVL